MAIRYTRFQSLFKVEDITVTTMQAAAADVKVIDLTATPYDQGIRNAVCVLQNMTTAGSFTFKAMGNTAADGSGTDTDLQSMTVAAADTDAVLEIPGELLSHFEDANDTTFLSLVFEIDGTSGDSVNAVVITEPLYSQQSLTPADTTTVS